MFLQFAKVATWNTLAACESQGLLVRFKVYGLGFRVFGLFDHRIWSFKELAVQAACFQSLLCSG